MALMPAVKNSGATLLLHSRSGAFRPLGIELGFGWDERLTVPDVLTGGPMIGRMVGRIDMIDHAIGENAHFFRVIDFKSSGRGLALDDVFDGIDLQLAGYLHVVDHNAQLLFGEPAFPAAMLYLGVRQSYSQVPEPAPGDQGDDAGEDDSGEDVLEGPMPRRMSGFVLMDLSAAKLMDRVSTGRSPLVPLSFDKSGNLRKLKSVINEEDFRRVMQAFAEVSGSSVRRIAEGDVAIAPWRKNKRTACEYCAFSAVCEFDTSRGSYRVLRRDSAEVVQHG
jgi:ATP-dependent helicase/nuclease subunit B